MSDSQDGPGPAARASLLVAPVGFGGLGVVGGQDFGGEQFDDGDGGVVGDGQDLFPGVGGAGAGVVHACGSAEAHFAECVEAVISQPVMAGGGGAGGFGLWQGGIGGCWCVSGECAVGPVVVVAVAEGVELVLQLGEG